MSLLQAIQTRARTPLTINGQIQLVMVGISTLVTILFGVIFYLNQRESLVKEADARLYAVATLARATLPADYHDRITGPESVSDGEFQKIVDRNNRLCLSLGLEYIWSLMLVDGRIVFTSSTSPDKCAANRKHAKFFETHSNPEIYRPTFESMKPTYRSNQDKWGDIRAVLIPAYDAHGRKYLFGASYRWEMIEGDILAIVWKSLAIGLGFFVLSVAAGCWLTHLVTRPVQQLTDTIQGVADGKHDLKAAERGSYEQMMLARHFNRMNRTLQDKIAELEKARAWMAEAHESERHKALAELGASEQRYRELLNFAVDGILIGSHEGIITEANECMCAFFNKTRSELIGKSIREMPFTPESISRIPFRFDLLQKGEKVISERAIRRADGSEIIIEMHTKMMADGTYQSIYRDITGRKRAEELLKKSEQRYRDIMTFAVDSILVTNHEGIIIEANENLCEVCGLSRAELIGHSILGLPFTPGSLREYPLRIDRVERGETVVSERTIRRGDGSEVVVEMHTKKMPDGYHQSIWYDITERKKTETQLAETRRLLDVTQSIAHLGGWEVDFTTGKVTWTDEVYRIYGVGRDFDISNPRLAFSFYDEECRARLVQAATEGIAAGLPFDMECRFVRADGERIWVRAMGQPARVDGQVVKANGILIDITARKRAEEALLEARGLLDEAQQMAKLGAWKYEVDTGHTIWTDEVYRIHGVGRDFDTSDVERLMSFYVPEHVPVLRQAMQRASEQGEPFDLELEFLRANGERIWVRACGRANIENGRTVSISGSFMDINERKQAELSLTRSEQRYRNLINFAVDGILSTDQKDLIIDANECLCRFCGMTRDELVGMSITELPFAPESLRDHPLRLDWVHEGLTVETERVIRRRDGTEVMIEMRSKKMPDGTHQSFWHDITQRKQEEETLRETRRMLEEAQDIAKLGAWKYDRKKGSLTWTDEVYRIHGVSRDYDIDSLTKGASFLVPEHAQIMNQIFREAVEQAIPYDVELELVRADGIHRWVRASGRPVVENGKVVRVVGNLMDVTERRQAEQALRDSQDRYRQLFEMESDALFLIDNETWQILELNQAALGLYGYSREAFLRLRTVDVTAEPEVTRSVMKRLLSEGESVVKVPVIRHRKSDGTVFPVEIMCRAFTMKGRKVFLAAVRDITERMKAQELMESWNAALEKKVTERTAEAEQRLRQLKLLTGRLIQAEESERQRISAVLHEDLQQTLVAARMTLNLPVEPVRKVAAQESLKRVDAMLSESIRLTRTLVQTLAVPAAKEGDLPAAVDWIAQQMKNKFGLNVDLTVDERLGAVGENAYLCIYRAVQEILFNIVKHANVLQAEIDLRLIGERLVQVTVKDRGRGVPVNVLSEGNQAGSGVGLYTIRERIEGLGGQMRIVGAEGQGTSVVLTVPTHDAVS